MAEENACKNWENALGSSRRQQRRNISPAIITKSSFFSFPSVTNALSLTILRQIIQWEWTVRVLQRMQGYTMAVGHKSCTLARKKKSPN